MVRSIISPDHVNYNEKRGLDQDDLDYSTNVYDYKFSDLALEIALGKEKFTYSSRGIVYFSIYLIVADEPVSRIGIFEVADQHLLNITEEDGSMDLSKGHILLFVKLPTLYKLIGTGAAMKAEKIVDEPIDLDVEVLDNMYDDDNENDDTLTRITVEKNRRGSNNTDSNKGVFEIKTDHVSPALLGEEFETESDAIKADYAETGQTNWIEKITRNNNYDMKNSGSGCDSLFASIRDAFGEIGHITTVSQLRELVAKHMDEDLYKKHRSMFDTFHSDIQMNEKEMKSIQKMIATLKKRNERASNKLESERILDEANELVVRYKILAKEKKDTAALLNEHEHMATIDTVDKYREYLRTSLCPSGKWMIEILEKELNIKIILLSEDAYKQGDKDAVMDCGYIHKTQTDEMREFVPNYYLMMSYTGTTYHLVSYKKKLMYKFREIPYDVRSLIVNKCLEQNSGPYYLLKDFRTYKTKIGLDSTIGDPFKNEDDEMLHDMYDRETVFMFHQNSNSKPSPGRGSGEHIRDDKQIDYRSLNKIRDWRRMLDDTWTAPITLDGHRWNSVKQYYLAAQYKKGFPDFYLKFSLDSSDEIGADIEKAICAASKTGKYKTRQLRPADVKIDPDFFEISTNNRGDQERKDALMAKFTQNQDLKQALMETRDAKLIHFERGKEPIIDTMLMKIRKEIR